MRSTRANSSRWRLRSLVRRSRWTCEAKPLTALPELSQHVSDAMAAAWQLGKADLPLTVGQLLAGALSIECSFITALRERGVRPGPFTSPSTEETDRPTVMAEPSADTVPEVDIALSDRLNLGREVEMLASVMLASDTPLPLAIGLFGDWGSGKSFFMRMLDERMAQLAALQPEVHPPEEPVYCRHIRQVHFNAWHYVDGNLWASLAATIFEGLVDEADPTVQEQKRDQLGEATKTAIEARDARVKAEQTLRKRQEKAGQVSTIVRSAVPAALQALREAGNLREELDAKGSMSEAAEQFVAAADAARATGRQAALLTGLVRSELVKGRWVADAGLAGRRRGDRGRRLPGSASPRPGSRSWSPSPSSSRHSPPPCVVPPDCCARPRRHDGAASSRWSKPRTNSPRRS